ncbi:MAG: hypothetical protein QM784_35010 [Polyangiaceae bacterium]
MTNVSDELQQLLQIGRAADRPTVADRERNRRQLQLRLGIAVGLAAHPVVAASSPLPIHFVIAKIAGIALASIALVVGGVLELRHAQTDATSHGPVAATSPTEETLLDGSSASLEIAIEEGSSRRGADASSPVSDLPPRSSKSVHGSAVAVGSAHGQDHLSEEVELLARAQTALRGGRLDHALAWLGEHERRFRRGILAEERIAAKIQVLCALGRVSEADALLSRLSPRSVHGEASQHACGGPLRGARKGGAKGSNVSKGALPQGK